MNTFFSLNNFFFDNRKTFALLMFALFSFCALTLQAETIPLTNAGFEAWTDSLPDAWYGSTSNIDSSAVKPSEDAYEGMYSCCLVKTQKTHARFSSQVMPLKAGYYQLSYYAKGKGDVRNTFHKGTSYDAYSEYTTLSSDEWRKIDYVFQVKADLDSAQLIFSVASTSKEGILIDALNLETTSKPDAIGGIVFHSVDFWVQDGRLHIETEREFSLRVLDLLGRCVLQTNVSEGFSSFVLERGCYLLSVDEASLTQKIMIP